MGLLVRIQTTVDTINHANQTSTGAYDSTGYINPDDIWSDIAIN
jgi:hypothetical protein